jgi:hypothetical protein
VIDLYTWTTPNGRKASIALEEFGLPYTAHPVDIGHAESMDARASRAHRTGGGSKQRTSGLLPICLCQGRRFAILRNRLGRPL